MKRRIHSLTILLTSILILGLLAAVSFALVDLDAFPKGDDNRVPVPGAAQATFIQPTLILPTFVQPTFTIPTFSQPIFTLPPQTLPTFTQPTITLPTQTLPTITLPTQTQPTITLPTQTLPTITLPGQTGDHASWTPRAKKVLTGDILKDDYFYFELRLGDAFIQAVTNDAAGEIVFDTIQYTAADVGKTFIYTIREQKPLMPLPGMFYDPMVITIQVNVSAGGTGEVYADPVYPSDMTFHNIYSPVVEWLPEGRKIFANDDLVLSANEFQFELALYDRDRDVYDLVDVYGHAANGAIGFEPILFSEQDIGKEIIYRMREVHGSVPGMVYSYNVVHIALDVAYDDQGELSVTPTYFILYVEKDGKALRVPVDEALFSNGFVPTTNYVHWTPVVNKMLSGRPLAGGEFTFSLDYGNFDGYRRATNNAAGTVQFAPLVYTSDDVGKTYVYTVHELVPKTPEPGKYYDPRVITIKVTVYATAEGDLYLAIQYPEDKTFHNHIETDNSITVEVFKVLEGRDLKAGEFEFALLDENDNLVQTATNASDGTVAFTPFYFTAEDIGTVLRYKVREIAGSEPGMRYSSETVLVYIDVTADGQGGFYSGITYAGERHFINTYEGDPGTVQWSPQGKKILTASGRALQADEFSFELSQYNSNTVDFDFIGYYGHAADGTFNFPAFTFDKTNVGKPVSYRIREVIPATPEPGMTYDTRTIYVELNITEDMLGNVVVTPHYYYIDEAAQQVITVDQAVFENVSDLGELSGEWSPEGKIILSADGRTLEDDEFSFELSRYNVVTMAYEPIGTFGHAADGTIHFPMFTFAQTDIHSSITYRMREVIPATPEPDMVYDSHAVSVRLYISPEAEGGLAIDPLYYYIDEAAQQVIDVDMAIFTNRISDGTATGLWQPEGLKMLSAEGRTLQEDEFAFELTLYNPDTDAYDLVGIYGHAADGTISFPPIEFTEDDVGKSFIYRMREVPGNEPDMNYAFNHYHVSLQVAYGPPGELIVTPSYYVLYTDGAGNHLKVPVQEAAFLNTYMPAKQNIDWGLLQEIAITDEGGGWPWLWLVAGITLLIWPR